MNRPLMQHGVGQLEQLFAASKADPKVLKQLENELRYRQVPRAVALLADVQGALYSQQPTEPVKPPTRGMTDAPAESDLLKSPPVQPPLWTLPADSSGGTPKQQPELPLVSGKPAVPPLRPASVVTAQAPATGAKLPHQREAPPPPLVTLADAYKLFKATSSSSWESIEQARRLAVQASSPTRLSALSEAQRMGAREEARKFNAAYEVLSRSRSSQASS